MKNILFVCCFMALSSAAFAQEIKGISTTLAAPLDILVFKKVQFSTPISTLNKLFKLNRRITTFFIHNDADRM